LLLNGLGIRCGSENLKIDYFSSSRRALTNDLQHGTAGSAHCEAPALLGQNPKFKSLLKMCSLVPIPTFLIGTHVVAVGASPRFQRWRRYRSSPSRSSVVRCPRRSGGPSRRGQQRSKPMVERQRGKIIVAHSQILLRAKWLRAAPAFTGAGLDDQGPKRLGPSLHDENEIIGPASFQDTKFFSGSSASSSPRNRIRTGTSRHYSYLN